MMYSIKKTQQQRTEEARDKIIRASFICFGKFGYHQTSFKKIADEAGCSQALTRYHFGSKDELVKELIDIYEQNWNRLFKEPGEQQLYGSEALDYIFDELNRSLTKDTAILKGQLALLFAAIDPGNKLIRSRFKKYQSNTRKEILKLLTASFEQQEKIDSQCVDDLSKFILCCFRGVASLWVIDGDIANVRSIIETMRNLIKDKFDRVDRSLHDRA